MIGRLIRDRRTALGVTQHDVANVVGTYRPIVARTERGLSVPRLDTLAAYSDALAIPMREFFKCADRALAITEKLEQGVNDDMDKR